MLIEWWSEKLQLKVTKDETNMNKKLIIIDNVFLIIEFKIILLLTLIIYINKH